MLENYLEKKNKLIRCIEKLDYYCRNYGNQRQNELLMEQKEKLNKSHFNLSVLGQFKTSYVKLKISMVKNGTEI